MRWARLAVVLALLCGSSRGEMTFSVSDCASERDAALVTFPEVTVSPHPVHVPGDVEVSARMQVRREITGSITLEMEIWRYVGFFWFPLPCANNVGSCTYYNVCETVSAIYSSTNNATTTCPQYLADSHVPCTCPIPPAHYVMHPTVFHIPEMTGVWSVFSKGDYMATARVLDSTGQELACQNAEFTLTSSCDSFFCRWFGR